CPKVADEWSVVRDLLLLPSAQRPSMLREAAAFPAPVATLLGPRWAMLADTVVLVALVDGGAGQLRLMYRSSSGLGSGVFDAVAKDGRIHAVLSNRAMVNLSADGDSRILPWTTAGSSGSIQECLRIRPGRP